MKHIALCFFSGLIYASDNPWVWQDLFQEPNEIFNSDTPPLFLASPVVEQPVPSVPALTNAMIEHWCLATMQAIDPQMSELKLLRHKKNFLQKTHRFIEFRKNPQRAPILAARFIRENNLHRNHYLSCSSLSIVQKYRRQLIAEKPGRISRNPFSWLLLIGSRGAEHEQEITKDFITLLCQFWHIHDQRYSKYRERR